ncbi:DUF6474 family protein [Tomitella biformata]|uniref:DUF6474 family protein n=1 Tax=Tomitella biformata TaxID=630403 RepID=UPI0004679262|nr:DUF6474 family protein [Tomitella biformata]
MGLFRKKRGSRRAQRKAEAAALKHKAGLEAKLGARNVRKRDKAAARTDKKATKSGLKSDRATHKNELRIAQEQRAAIEAGKFNAKKVGRYLGVARVVAPVVLPLAYRGATLLRAQLDQRRAQKLGVPVDQLGQFSGSGAKLSARIAGAERTLTKLSLEKPRDAEVAKFVSTMKQRLAELAAATDAAESMSAERRRRAHSAIARELDGIEADVLAYLGVV